MNSEANVLGRNQNVNMENNNPITYAVRTENSPFGNLPLDVTKDLNEFSKFFVAITFDSFRSMHCCEKCLPSLDFMIYGELPDGDKKLLFTCSKHNEFCKCCDNCIITCFCLCDYVCCNSIVFQMDYKRNNQTFYTQGLNIQKGCYCCKCNCCFCCCCCGCCPPSHLYLRENVDPNNPDFNVGIKKGRTTKIDCCLADKTVSYFPQEDMKGPSIRAKCCSGCCCDCSDIIMDIEDGNGGSIGKILIPNGCNSEKVKGMCCHLPRPYYEINISQNITSEQKFQIIADVVHFSLAY